MRIRFGEMLLRFVHTFVRRARQPAHAIDARDRGLDDRPRIIVKMLIKSLKKKKCAVETMT